MSCHGRGLAAETSLHFSTPTSAIRIRLRVKPCLDIMTHFYVQNSEPLLETAFDTVNSYSS